MWISKFQSCGTGAALFDCLSQLKLKEGRTGVYFKEFKSLVSLSLMKMGEMSGKLRQLFPTKDTPVGLVGIRGGKYRLRLQRQLVFVLWCVRSASSLLTHGTAHVDMANRLC